MKVILLKDVPKVGKKYEVKDVAPGFATNSLIPEKLAVIATPKTLALYEAKKAERDAEQTKHIESLKAHKAVLEKTVVTLEAKANAKGHLFAGITKETIAEALSQTVGMSIDASLINLPHPLKEAGEHAVEIALGDMYVQVKVVVEAE